MFIQSIAGMFQQEKLSNDKKQEKIKKEMELKKIAEEKTEEEKTVKPTSEDVEVHIDVFA